VLKPDFAPRCNARGNTMKSAGRYEEALASYDRAVALEPDFAAAFL
jgi:predicted RNA polymerase sigma factor